MNDDTILAELRAMRAEQSADHGTLVAKLDRAADVHAQHEIADLKLFEALSRRVLPLESTHRSLKWATRGALGLVGVGLVDFFFDHLPKWLR